jgi:hypothetical protein
MNLALLSSVARRVPGAAVDAQARTADGYCCVAFIPAS